MGCDDYCCVPLCNHKRGRDSTCQTFYTIPREPKWLYEQWQARIKRYFKDESGKIRKWEATDNHRICDCHFTEKEKKTILHSKCRKPGRKLVLPSIFPGTLTPVTNSKKQRTTSRSTNRVYVPPVSKNKPRKLYFATPLKCNNSVLRDLQSVECGDREQLFDDTCEMGNVDNLDNECTEVCAEATFLDENTLDDTCETGNIENLDREYTEVCADASFLDENTEQLQTNHVASAPHGHDYIQTQTDRSSFEFLEKEPSLKRVLDTAKNNEKIADKFRTVNENCQLLSLENVKANPKLFKYYTGFSSYDVFEALFKYLEPKASFMKYPYGERTLSHSHFHQKFSIKPGVARKFSLREEMFMTLVRLRVGVPVADMATRYGIADSTYSSIFTAWVCLLAIELEKICKLKGDCGNSNDKAECFSEFQNLKIILDCTELFAETPSSLAAHKQLFSNYKHHSTMKFLVGMNTGGAITYISEMYGGLSSDKYITSESVDLLDALNPGEKVMVDRGFTISENLPPGVNLIMPSFKHKNKSQFTKEEVKRNKKISEARVHIERAIRRIKQFEIFSKEVKMSQKDIYENMFKTCGYLVNFQDPFLKV